MSRHFYNRTALFIVTTPPDFRPQRAWHVPDAFTAGTLYMKNMSVHEARGFARTFNAKQIQLFEHGKWDHSWMIVSSCCRPSKWHENGQSDAATIGGAA
jgi:hypothetical protein